MLEIITYASGSDGNLYLIKNSNTRILIEAGVDAKKIRKNLISDGMFITELDGCVISHNHQDHSLSADYVSYYVKTYSTQSVCKKYKDCVAVTPKVPFKIGDIKVLAIPIYHGECENNAYIFMDKDSCIFFGTDFSLMEQNVSNFSFDKIMIECNYDDNELAKELEKKQDEKHEKYLRQLSTHMSKVNCMVHLDAMNLSKCNEIILLHNSKFLINKNQTIKDFESKYGIKTIFANQE